MKQYQCVIEYGIHSATMSSFPNIEDAKRRIAGDLTYYKDMAIREAYIEAFCDKCMNEGTYKMRRPRSTKTVKCECGGNIKERYEYILVKS